MFNFPAFDRAEKSLKRLDWNVISPARMGRESGHDPEIMDAKTDWHDYKSVGVDVHKVIDRNLRALQSSDAIYMLYGWEISKGATAEHAIAMWLGLEVFHEAPKDILLEAHEITNGDRQNQYGPPDQDFQRTAAMWSALKGVPFEPRDVALFMVALKLSRETHQRKRDNAVDIAGYARCLHIRNEAASKRQAEEN